MATRNCDHCDAGFGSEKEELEHVLEEHDDTISSHKRDKLKRRLNKLDAGDGSGSSFVTAQNAKIAGGAVAVVAFIGALFYGGVITFDNTGGSTGGVTDDPSQVGPPGSVHEHAAFSVFVNGDRIDFSQPRYQLQSNTVHFESGDGTTIHKHATGVTINHALQTLGMNLNGSCLTVHSRDYCATNSSGELTVEAGGDAVEDPSSYVIRDGEPVVIRYDG